MAATSSPVNFASLRASCIGGGVVKYRSIRYTGTCNRSRVNASLASRLETADIRDFINEVAGLATPKSLNPLLSILQAKGEVLVSPENRNGYLPLAIPLTKDLKTGEFTALLRWPTPPDGLEMPVVRLNSYGVTLKSKTIDDFVRRTLAEEEAVIGGAGPLAEAALEEGRSLYTSGSFLESGIPKIEVYLTRKVALFPDILERLALGHLERGDEVSALVTGDFYTRQHFPGFGRPFVFNSQLLARVGRPGEAKDAAKSALRSPWWTLGASFQEVSDVAGYSDTQLEFVKEKLTDEVKNEDLTKGKAPAQVALDQAAFLLDLSSAEGTWDANRHRLAELYEEGGLPHIAKFVLHGI